MSACMAVECLRRDLTENLENHVKGERRIGLDWGGISLHEYQKRERSTRERYSSHVDVETIERVKREVEATVFAYSRRQVEKCFRDLSGTAHEQYEACRSMFSQLFQPLANEMSQDAADWFSSLGGVSKLMPLLQKTYSDFCSSNWEDQDLESLCLVALKAMKCYASDDERLLIAYDHGMLDMIIDVLCKAKTGQTKYECGKLSCTFLDDKVCQVKFVHSGAFRPLLDMASDPTTLLYVVDSIIAGITCCAVNAAVLDSMIEHDVAGRFFYLAQDIYKLHRHELSGNVFMFRGINMISLLPLHISYLCYVGISLLLHQRSWRHWLELMNTVRQTGRPSSYDAVKSTLKAMPLSDKDEEMLQAVKLFISETNPNQVIFKFSLFLLWTGSVLSILPTWLYNLSHFVSLLCTVLCVVCVSVCLYLTTMGSVAKQLTLLYNG